MQTAPQTPTFPNRAVLEIFPHLHSRQHLLGGDPQLLSVLVFQHMAGLHWPIVCESRPSIMDICHLSADTHRLPSWWNNREKRRRLVLSAALHLDTAVCQRERGHCALWLFCDFKCKAGVLSLSFVPTVRSLRRGLGKEIVTISKLQRSPNR